MKEADFIPLPVEPAICEGAGARRSSARRIWVSYAAPGPELASAAAAIAVRCPQAPGRVHSLGEFVDRAVHAALTAQLPDRTLSLRGRFEWYACRGAGFHNDAHYGGVLFGVWCAYGPPRELVFPRASTRAPAAVGDLVVFDPFEPHAVLDPGQIGYARERFEGTAPSVFVGFEIKLDAAARAAFGSGAPPASGAILSSAVPINAETGALRRACA